MTVCSHSRHDIDGIGLFVQIAVIPFSIAPALAESAFEGFSEPTFLGCWVYTPPFGLDHIPAGESGWAKWSYQWDEENLEIVDYDKKGSTKTLLCRPVLSDSRHLKLTRCSMPDVEWTKQSFNDVP